MQPWFEERPERLDYELQALSAAGYSYTLDDAKKAAGIIEITVQFPLNGDLHPLKALFPDSYPYLPMSILGSTLPHGRHICPSSGSLCLLQNPHSTWSIKDTLAGMLNNQVNDIIRAHIDPTNAVEAQDGAQRSGQYFYTPESVILTSDWTIPKEHSYGTLIIGLERRFEADKPVRGAVLEVQDSKGNPLAQLDKRISQRYGVRIRGRWVRLAAPPDGREDGPGPLADGVNVANSLSAPKLDGGVDIVGLLFPEESSRGVMVENWLFTIRAASKDKSIQNYSLSRTDCLDQANMMARVASLIPLASKKVLVVGLGSVGSMIAWQLARAGIGQLSLIDHDFVQVGNMPRWLLGLPYVGRGKASGLGEFLNLSYPYTSTWYVDYKLGAPRQNVEATGDGKILEMVMQDVDLVIDATAEWGVSHMLSDICQSQGVAYIWATGTPGSRGGVVGRVIPGETKGCWKCFQHHQSAGSIITPVQDDLPEIQPKGCFHPTFTGTGFDMDEVSLAAVRLAASTLCNDQSDTYPALGWDVGIVNLWDGQGKPIAPAWTTYDLAQHPECGAHD